MSTPLDGILKQLDKAYQGMKEAYWAFGDAMIGLRKHGYSWDAATQLIQARYPEALVETGRKLSKDWLRSAHDMAETFAADGGLVSPDGKHSASREQMTALGLSSNDRDRLVNLVKASASTSGKGTKRLKVSDIASAVKAHAKASTDAERLAAKQALLDRMSEVEESLVAVAEDDQLTLLRNQVASKFEQLERAQKRALKLKAEYDELQAQLKALTESQTAPKAEPVSNSAKVRRRPSRKAEHAAPASA